MAKISLIGRLAAQPEHVPTSTGRDVIKYAVVTNYGPRDEQKTSWWRVVSYPKEGSAFIDFCRSLGKGQVFPPSFLWASKHKESVRALYLLISFFFSRTLVYVEGNATCTIYENKEGHKLPSVNIRQSRSLIYCCSHCLGCRCRETKGLEERRLIECIGRMEVLAKRDVEAKSEQDQDQESKPTPDE